MAPKVDDLSGSAPVKSLEALPGKADRMLKKIDGLLLAKQRIGAALKRAMGGRALKEFGDAGQMSNMHSGSTVPDYLARIYLDPGARRRLALALLEDDESCSIETIVRLRA